jgi:hypothetical protein
MKFENSILCERSQTQKVSNCGIPLIGNMQNWEVVEIGAENRNNSFTQK